MDITILPNIACILGSIQFKNTEYYMQHYPILDAKSYTITQYYMHIGCIQHNITEYLVDFIKITQYYREC